MFRFPNPESNFHLPFMVNLDDLRIWFQAVLISKIA